MQPGDLFAGEQVHGVFVHHFQCTATAASNAGQRVFGNDHRQTGFLGQQLVEVTQQGATTGQYQTTLGDIGSQFRRRLLQRALNSLNDGSQGLLQSFQHFVGVQGECAWNAFGQVATANIDFANFAARVGRTDFLLDALGGGFADQAAVVATHVGDDRFVEAVAANPYGFGVNHTVQGNQRDFGRTTTDIDNHRAASFFYRQAGTDRSRHWLFDQEHFTGTGTKGRFTDGATLHLGGFAGNADQHTRARLQKAVFVNLVDKVLQHLFADAEVGNDAVLHRTNGGNVARRTAEHALGLGADSNDTFLVTVCPNSHNRWLIQDDTALAHVNKGVGSAQVNGKIAGKHATQFLEHGKGTLGNAWVKKCGKL